MYRIGRLVPVSVKGGWLSHQVWLDRMMPEGWLPSTSALALDADDKCDLRIIDVRDMSAAFLAASLADTDVPVLLRGAFVNAALNITSNRQSFLQRNGALNVLVGTVGTLGTDWSPSERHPSHIEMPLAHYAEFMRNGSLPGSYVFTDISQTTLAAEVRALSLLFGHVARRRLPISSIHGTRLRAAVTAAPALAFAGTPLLAMGGDGSGGAFHFHAEAIAALLVGRKRWFIRRQRVGSPSNADASVVMEMAEHEAEAAAEEAVLRRRPALAFFNHLQASTAGRRRLSEGYWQCIQRAGDALFLPPGYEHAVLNHGERCSRHPPNQTRAPYQHVYMSQRPPPSFLDIVLTNWPCVHRQCGTVSAVLRAVYSASCSGRQPAYTDGKHAAPTRHILHPTEYCTHHTAGNTNGMHMHR